MHNNIIIQFASFLLSGVVVVVVVVLLLILQYDDSSDRSFWKFTMKHINRLQSSVCHVWCRRVCLFACIRIVDSIWHRNRNNRNRRNAESVSHHQQPKRKNGRMEGKWMEDGVRGNDEKRNSAEVRSHNNINTFPWDIHTTYNMYLWSEWYLRRDVRKSQWRDDKERAQTYASGECVAQLNT